MTMTPASTTAADTTIDSALRRAAARLDSASDSPALDAEVLLAFVLDHPRSWLLARRRESLAADTARLFETLIARRAEGRPVAYLTGTREFWSRPFRVTPDTLIPRPETEHLVEAALARLPAARRCEIADPGTGSGIIALTLALERPDCRVTATDISHAALAVARDNAARLGVTNVGFHHGDWFAGLEGRVFDLIASNPPYVASSDPYLALGDLRYEPPIALASGATGLEAIHVLIAQARDQLAPGGWLLLEHGFDQAAAVAALFAEYGYVEVESLRDLAGHPRIAAARRPGHGG
jgi:release factor glutamine methyltransferase